jgi:5-formyltetrahydrofolate cyclo-ligase
MTKKELRKIYKEKRKAVSYTESGRLDDLLLIRFQQWPLPAIQTVLSYVPLNEKGEVNTMLMTGYLNFRVPGLQVAYPVIDASDHIFKPVIVHEQTEFLPNMYGIDEPVNGIDISSGEIDLVFVPLLAFDNRGYRVGYGKGFYDRFLETCREDVLKIGFSYFEAEDAIDDINQFDVPLNVCITPNKIYEF